MSASLETTLCGAHRPGWTGGQQTGNGAGWELGWGGVGRLSGPGNRPSEVGRWVQVSVVVVHGASVKTDVGFLQEEERRTLLIFSLHRSLPDQ